MALTVARNGAEARITGSGFKPGTHLQIELHWIGDGDNPDTKTERHKALVADGEYPGYEAGEIDITIPLPEGGTLEVTHG